MCKARNHAMKSIEIKRHCATSRLDLGSFTRHPRLACGTCKTPVFLTHHFGKLLRLLLAGPPILRCLLAETMDMASIPRFSKPSPTGFECTVPLHFLSIPQHSLKYSIHTSMDPKFWYIPRNIHMKSTHDIPLKNTWTLRLRMIPRILIIPLISRRDVSTIHLELCQYPKKWSVYIPLHSGNQT